MEPTVFRGGVSAALLELHLSVLLLSGTGLFARLIHEAPLVIVGWRAPIAALCLTGLLLLQAGPRFVRTWRAFGLCVLLGILLGLHWVTYYTAIQRSGVAIATIALFSYPTMTAILEPLSHKRAPSRRPLLLGVLVLVGVGFLGQAATHGAIAWEGIAWGLLSALLYTLRNVIFRRYLLAESPEVVTVLSLFVIFVMLAPWSLPHVSNAVEQPLLVLTMGVLFTAVPHTLMVRSLRRISATSIGLIACLQPGYAALGAWWVLGEVPTLPTMLGAVAVMSASAWETYASAARSTETPASHEQEG